MCEGGENRIQRKIEEEWFQWINQQLQAIYSAVYRAQSNDGQT